MLEWSSEHVTEAAISRRARFSPAGLSPEVCVTDEGHTTRPVRSEGVAHARKVVDLDLGGVEDGQGECEFGSHAEEEPAMSRNVVCESDGGEENVPGGCRSLAHPRTSNGNAMWCLTCRSRIGAGLVWPGTMINFHSRAFAVAT